MLSSLAVIAVLGGVVLGGWLLWGGQPLPASARNIPPTGEAGRLAADSMAIADFDSGSESYAYVRSFRDVLQLNFLNPVEVAAYTGHGAGAARMVVSSKRPEGKVIVVVTRMADRAAALQAADELEDLQFQFGFARRPAEQGVERLAEFLPGPETDPAGRPTARAHYVHGDLLVRVELNAKTPDDAANRFSPLLTKQLTELRADG